MAGIANLFALIDQLKRNVGRNLQDPIGAVELGLLRADKDFKADPVNTVLGNANIGGGLLGMTKMVKPPKAPQADALETARRNAVKMLGLPENNTAMDRARAMGFDTPVYHGTFNDFDAFDISKANPRSQYMPGVFTADNPAMSENFGDIIMPLLQKKGITVRDKRLARKEGREVPELDTIYDAEKGIMVTNRPENLRSRFAAFDPARRNEANLLASRLLPLALPGLLFAGDEEE